MSAHSAGDARTSRLRRPARTQHRRLSEAAGMPPVTHGDVRVERDLPVVSGDGTVLRTDHWFPVNAGGASVLIRTPYGRRAGAGLATFLAERGHHVVVQSCRGTFVSGGVFDPLHHEAADGQAALAWIRAQSWATGPVHALGFSYVGLTAWALCEGDDRPDAMVIGASSRRFDESIVYPGGGFAMETTVVWPYALDVQEMPVPVRLWRFLTARRRVAKGCLAIPPENAMTVAIGHRVPFFEDWLAHASPGDPWWEPLHFGDREGSVPPVTLLAGWQDLFLLGGFADYRALRERGVPVRLIVGDWTHDQGEEAEAIGARELLRALDGEPATGSPLRIQVTGGPGWRDLEDWPPPAQHSRWYPTAAGSLADAPIAGQVSYRYDPADPTPEAGGRTLNPFASGRRDQREREQRDDVLVFTGAPLERDLTVIGEPDVEVRVSSTNQRVDLFLRLCDLGPDGVSHTVADGYLRLRPEVAAGEERSATVRLAPMAHRFAAGRRIRLQLSSGAHPLHLRNPGTPDPLHDFSALVPSDQTVRFGEATVLRLPVVAS